MAIGTTDLEPHGSLDREAALKLAVVAFQDAGSEISSRLAMREKLVEVYLVSSISLLAAFLVAARLVPDFPISLYVVAPILSLTMSLLIKSHYVALEALANYIRTDLNTSFIHLGAWAPYWDYHNRNGDTGRGTKLDKSRARFAAHVCAIHTPTLVSLIVFGATVIYEGRNNISATDGMVYFNGFVFIISVFIFLYAVGCTVSTIGIRDTTNQTSPAVPSWASNLVGEQMKTQKTEEI